MSFVGRSNDDRRALVSGDKSFIGRGSGEIPSLYLASYLGYTNVFVNGVPWSFSQQGDFTSAEWNVVGESVTTVGPNADFPNGLLKFRLWAGSKRLIIYVFNGQSNCVGGNTSFSGGPPFVNFTVENPLPRFQCFVGGLIPTQTGSDQVGVNTIIDAQNYASLVPAHEAINTYRTSPDRNVVNECWSTSFGEVIASSVDSSNVVLVINVGHGATTFVEDVQRVKNVANATWLDGVGTYEVVDGTTLQVGDTFEITNANPTGWRGIKTVVSANSDGSIFSAAIAVDPGAYVPNSGNVKYMAAPMVNARTMVRYAVDTLAPAMGLTPVFGGLGFNGNESASTLPDEDTFATMYATLRGYTNELGAICGTPTPWIIWPQVGYPRSSWRENRPGVLATATFVALGVLETARDPANKCITYPMYSSLAGGTGDDAGACNHYGVQGHSDNGERGANLYLDAVIGDADPTPVEIVSGSLVRVANSTTITGTLSRASTIDMTQFISDPGDNGFQAFASVPDGGGGNGYEVGVDSVSIVGTDLTIELTSVPASDANKVGYSYMNSDEFIEANNIKITNATWAAGEATYTTAAPHGLVEGDGLQIAQMEPDDWDIIPSQQCLAGTSGTTIVLAKASDPGSLGIVNATWSLGVATFTASEVVDLPGSAWITVSGVTPSGYNGTFQMVGGGGLTLQVEIAVDPGAYVSGGTWVGGGNIAINGAYGLARNQGLRGQARADDIDHYSHRTGANLPRWHAIQFKDVDVYSSTPSIADTLTELGLDGIFDGVYDFAAAACYPGSGTAITNQGIGSNADYTLGDGGLRLPVYTGTPDSFSRDTYFASTGSAEINPSSGSNALLANAHKPGAEYTVILGGYLPATISANNYPLATCITEGGSQGPGCALRISSNRAWNWLVEGTAGAPVLVQSGGGALNASSYFLIGLGIQTGVGGSGSWVYNSARTTLFSNMTPVYSSPTTSAAQSLMTMGVNGTTGTNYLQNGVRLNFMLVSSGTFVSQPLILPLMRSLARRQLLVP